MVGKGLCCGLLVMLLLIGGCGKKRMVPPSVQPPASPVFASAPPPAPLDARARALPLVPESEEDVFARKTVSQLNAEQPLGDVFFDLDSTILDATALSTLQGNAHWLRRWTTTQIVVEGHCDERGSSEYNLALGARRAEVVREHLSALGVTPERMTAASKGKEQPACWDHGEGCWQRNRRGRFVITAK
jgi:peptidoglycan-associated lipoprotein